MKKFNKKDIKCLQDIMLARRDVRGNKFNNKKIKNKILNELLTAANCAPSVGFSQPWKFVIIKSKNKRNKIYDNFQEENNKAKKKFKNKPLYNSLKLEGIKESYLNIAVLYEKSEKNVLGQTSQKKMGEYSVVCAIQNFWLMARTYNIGVGWVSILKPKRVKKILDIDKKYKLIAYLSVGYVDEFLDEPELLKLGWSDKKTLDEIKVI
ncbi:MAG: 5,6-dimethylbenzimidazole synthase [Arcobacter sp.]|nr:MAG: 5,6-dimethylbenzimidazole synthase [Arcobacter sp.]